MAGVNYQNFEGVEILIIDFSGKNELSSVSDIVNNAIHIVSERERIPSLLALVDFTHCATTKNMMAEIKRMAGHNRPYIKKITLVGLPLLRSVMLNLAIRLSGRSNHKIFRNRSEAFDWLLKS